jgi:chromosome segregation ATPase
VTARLLLLIAVASTVFAADPTLDALLTEVRELRMAVQRAAAVGPRLQIAMRRLDWQEQRLARVSGQIDDLRKRISGTALRHAEVTARLKNAEAELTQTANAEHRKQLPEVIGVLKSELEQTGRTEAQLRSEEAALSAELRTEQAKADELASKIEGLELALTPPAQPPR